MKHGWVFTCAITILSVLTGCNAPQHKTLTTSNSPTSGAPSLNQTSKTINVPLRIDVLSQTNLSDWKIEARFIYSSAGVKMLSADIRYQGKAQSAKAVTISFGNGIVKVPSLSTHDTQTVATSMGDNPSTTVTLRLSWEENGQRFSGEQTFQVR